MYIAVQQNSVLIAQKVLTICINIILMRDTAFIAVRLRTVMAVLRLLPKNMSTATAAGNAFIAGPRLGEALWAARTAPYRSTRVDIH